MSAAERNVSGWESGVAGRLRCAERGYEMVEEEAGNEEFFSATFNLSRHAEGMRQAESEAAKHNVSELSLGQ